MPATKKTTKEKKAKRKARATKIDPLAKLRTICLALPTAVEALNHSHPCFSVNGKTFVMYLLDHHGDGRCAMWCKAPPGAQGELVDADPHHFFVPPYVGPRGWIGVHLDRGLDWSIVAELARESFRMTAPKRVLASLDALIER